MKIEISTLKRLSYCVWCLPILAACGTSTPAPVIDRQGAVKTAPAVSAVSRAAGPGFHVVKKGETLQTIALEHGQDYKDLAAWNNLEKPNLIRVGQTLRVVPPEGGVVVRPVSAAGPQEIKSSEAASPNTEALKVEPRGGKQPYTEQAWAAAQRGNDKTISASRPEQKSEPKVEPKVDVKADATASKDADGIEWAWPTKGKVIVPFAEGASNSKGIGISGKVGDPVFAAASGKVLYAGEDLRGYGKLVVLKHNSNFLSVYAHNSQILVKEGQMVVKGEKIAELGKSDSEQPKLHFEIRRLGKPVDPVKFLPAR